MSWPFSRKDEFLSEHYDKLLDHMLKMAQDEYKQITFDLPSYQKTVLRNYLWISTVVIAAEGTLFSAVVRGGWFFDILPWPPCLYFLFYLFYLVALACSVFVFVFGVNAMRGEGKGEMYCLSSRPYMEFANMAYEEACGKRTRFECKVNMINDLQNAIYAHRETADKTGMKLRKMSYGLLFSLLFTVFALLSSFSWCGQPGSKGGEQDGRQEYSAPAPDTNPATPDGVPRWGGAEGGNKQ